jgi:hypothetical protein
LSDMMMSASFFIIYLGLDNIIETSNPSLIGGEMRIPLNFSTCSRKYPLFSLAIACSLLSQKEIETIFPVKRKKIKKVYIFID